VPSDSDVVCIQTSGTYTVTVTGNRTITSLRLGGNSGAQTLSVGSGTVTLTENGIVGTNGVINFVSGNLDSGPGLTNEGLVVLTSSSSKTLGGRLINDGTIRWDQGHIYLTTNAVLENNDQFLVGGHSNGIYRSGSAPQRFVNNATIRRTAEGTSSLNLTFENNGLVDVQAGTLQVRGESYHNGGSFGVATGASLLFDSGTHTVSGTLSGNPDGSIVMSSTVVAGSNGAVFNFGGTGLKWSSGNLDGGPGLTNDGLVVLTSSSNKTLGGRLINDGTIRWDQGHIYLTTNAVLENNDQFLVGGHSNGIYRSGSAPQRFVNNATINRTADGTSSLNLTLENNGLIDVQSGTLQVRGESYHNGGSFGVATGASLLFDSGTHTVSGTLSGNPDGSIVMSSTVVAGSNGAVFNFGGTGLKWSSGNLDGGPGLTNDGLVVLTSSSNKTLGGRLINDGTIRWDQGHIYLTTNAVLENNDQFLVGGHSNGIYRSGSAPQRFVNNATINRTADGTSSLNLTLENNGLVDVQAGTLQIRDESYHDDARLITAADASLLFYSGTHTVSGSFEGTSAGVIAHSSNMIIEPATVFSFDGNGFQWRSGTLDGGSGLTNEGLIVLASASNKTLRGHLINDGTIRWNQGHIYLATGAVIENRETFRAATTHGIYPSGSAPQRFQNLGTLLKDEPQTTSTIDIEFDNRGSLAVSEGTLRFSSQSEHTNVTLDVRPDATLEFSRGTHFLTDVGLVVPTGATLTFGSGTHIITGTLAGDVEGLVQWTSGTMQAGSGGGTINIAGSGLQWQRGTISTTDNIFTNRGDIHIVGPAAKSLTAGTLRNEGMIEWIGGSFDINRDGILENMGSMLVKVEIERMGPAFSEAGALLNYGRFEKQAGEERVEIYPRFENKSGGNLAIHAGELRFRSLHNAPGAEISGDGGSFLVAASEFLNEGIVTPGASPGLLSYTGTYRSARSAELQIEIAGLEPGVSHDQFRLTGSGYLDGALDIRLLDGYRPPDGAELMVVKTEKLAAAKTEDTAHLYGGFTELRGAVNPALGLALFPSITPEGLILTAGTLAELESEITVSPASIQAGALREVVVSGSGFSPDVTVSLSCIECEEPDLFGSIEGLVSSVTPSKMIVWFDLSQGNISGDYELLVTDPRGGEARTEMGVDEGPIFLTAKVVKEASADGRNPGIFVVRANRTLRERLTVPFHLSGNAQQYVHYMTDVLGSSLTIPSGQDSVMMSVFPIAEGSDRSVHLQLQYDQPPLTSPMPAPPLWATMTLHGEMTSDEFRVLASNPASGGNKGMVTLQIAGVGFTESTTVTLGDALVQESVEVNENGTLLKARFDLSGQPVGPRHVTVSDGSNQAVLTNAFRIAEGIFPNVQVQLLVPPQVPRTRERVYTIVLYNEGNVDVTGHAVLSGLPVNSDWDVLWHDLIGPGGQLVKWRDVAPVRMGETHMTIELPTLTLGAGETRKIEVTAAIHDPQTLELIGGWYYR